MDYFVAYRKTAVRVTVGFSDTFTDPRGCHCNRRPLYDHFLLGTFFQIPENSEHLVNKLFFSFFSHLVQLILFPKFCTKPPIINHLLITEERAGGKEGTGAEIGEKGILQK